MILGPTAQWFAFIAFSLIGIAGALGMATTMSMFRSGIFLMASFMGVAGLFILLSADLLGVLQVMMYIGGMLVMILFMVLFSHDPGGAMMAKMELPAVEKFFSLGLASKDAEDDGGDGNHHKEGHHHSHHNGGNEAEDQHSGHDSGGDHRQMDHKMDQSPQAMNGHQEQSKNCPDQMKHSMEHSEDGHGGHGNGHEEMDMSMTTPIRPVAAVIGILTGLLLVGLLLWRPAWPVSGATPNPDSAQMVGSLLMGKYMIAFEGAGLLILIGIFGAVLVSRAARYPDDSSREAHVAVDDKPAPVEVDPLEPIFDGQGEFEPVSVTEVHQDERS